MLKIFNQRSVLLNLLACCSAARASFFSFFVNKMFNKIKYEIFQIEILGAKINGIPFYIHTTS